MQSLQETIHLLASAYPSFRPNPDILKLYVAKLSAYPLENVQDACNRIVETNRYFPTLSELITLAKAMDYNKDQRYPNRFRKATAWEATAFDDASVAMMKERGYKSVDQFTDADLEQLKQYYVEAGK